jgi:hypothetical protein
MHRRLILLSIIISFCQFSMAQVPVNLSGSIGGGLLVPQSSNLKGDMRSAYDYPLSKTGYDLNAKIRLGLPALPFAIIGNVSYNSLSDNAVLPASTPNGLVNANYTNALSIISAGVGLEYTMLPTPIIKPYIGANLVVNFISGSGTWGNNLNFETKLNSTRRYGVDLGIGTLIETPMLPCSLDLEAQYHLANLLGKTYSNAVPGFTGNPLTFESNLDDAKNPYDPKDHDRSINYFTVTLGFRFNII